MQALPNDALTVTANWTSISPELRYTINFANAGTYYVWIRGYAQSAESLSVYVGLNGASPAAAQIDLPKTGTWSWSNKAAGSAIPVAVTVPTAGQHTLNIWMRDAGFALDRIILTLNSAYSPEYSADFWRNQSIYQIITDRFFDGDTNNNVAGLPNYGPTNGGQAHGGDFKGIEKKLDYIQALGATAIWISPVVKNANGDYHGYAATDFYAVNPRMGTMSDLQRLIAEAHKRGILVINDVVANHASTWVDSSDAGWGNTFRYPPAGYTLRYNSGGNTYASPFDNASLTAAFGNTSLSNIFHNNCGNILNYGDATQVELGELVSLDDFRTESTYVRAKMKEIWTYWINTAGFDAYRIDTVKHVEMGFWDEWTPAIRNAAAAADKPNFFMFGEVFDGSDSKCGSYTGTKSGGNFKMDSVLDYPLYYLIGSVFATATGNTGQIEGRYGNLNTSNYDASALNSLVLNLDNHDNPRFLSTGIGGNTTRLEVALVFLYTSRGIPSLYYGTEQDFDGGADPWNREDMFDGQFEGGPSNGDNFNMTSPRFKLVAKLNNLRRLYPSLCTGSHNNLWNNGSGPGLFAYARRLGAEEVYVVLNTASTAQTIGARPTIHPAGTVLVNVLNPNETYTVTTGTDGIPSIVMPGNSYKMFVAQSQMKALHPVISAVSPAHDAAGVSTGSGLTVTFDRAMNPTTTQAAFSTVPATTGTFAWSAGNTVMTYTPSPMTGNTLYTVRIASTATDTNGLAMFAPFESRFTTGAASSLARPSINSVTFSGVTTRAATLAATVTPNGATTTVIFEYGPTTSYGTSTASQNIGSGNSPVAVNVALSGLLPGTTYHFRPVAQNSQGTTTGPDTTFTTDVVLPQVTTIAASFVTTSSASLNGDVNPNGIATTYFFEYGVKSDALDKTTPAQDAGSAAGLVSRWASISGLSPETTYYFRVVAQSGGNTVRGSVLSFVTLPVKPTFGVTSVLNLAPTSATVAADVNSNGTDFTVWFEYGTDTNYGSATSLQNVGAGVSPVTITADLIGLSFGQTYHFRAVAQNSFGKTYGSDQTFATGFPPPAVTTGSPTATTTNSATLSGSVNPNGLEAIYWFEYGTTPAYGQSTRSGASDDVESYNTTTLNYATTSAGATVTANGGTGFGQFTSYVRTTSAGTVNPTRGGIRCVTTNSINGTANRQIDGIDSLGVYAGYSTTTGNHSGYRPLTTPWKFGQVNFSVRFDISNTKGFTGINLKSANGQGFSDNELISVGLMPASGSLGGNTVLLVTDAAGQRNLSLGADVRGAVIDVRIDFDTAAGTYTCAAKFRADASYQTISGKLKLSGAGVSMTTLGYINGNNTGELSQHMILDNLQVVSAASAGGGTSPVPVSGSLGGLVPNTTYYYRAVAQNSMGQTAGSGSSFFTGANAAPTISNITDLTINRDTSTGGIPFTIGDIETAAASLPATASSSNKTLVPDANIVLGGSGANRTVTVTPAAGQTGTSTISVTVSDGGGLTATDSFVLTVNAPPAISTVADQAIDEDTATAAIPLTLSDAETAAASLTVTASSSNQVLIPDGNLVLGGSGANRTITATPLANANGVATITVSVSDGLATTTSAFLLSVNPVNDAPTISTIVNQATTVGTATSVLAFILGDNETAAGSLSVTASSSNPTLVPDGNIVLGGSGTNRTVTVTPAAGQAGTTTITITVNDGSLTASTSFVLTVNAPPTISTIAAQTIDEDKSTGAVAFMVGDAETSVASLTVSGSSSNQALVSDGNILFGGSGANRTVTITPAANAHGTATITVNVSDGQATASAAFLLTVNAVNDSPTISAITNQGVAMNTPTAAIGFTVGDVETAPGSLTLSGTTSNTTLVPDTNIVFGGSGANRSVTVTPAAGQFGTATITLTVSDGTATAQQSFDLTVTQGNATPTISDISDRTIFVGSNTGAIPFTVGDAETAASSLTLSRTSSNTTLVPTANIVLGGSGANRTVTVTPAAGQSGTATITIMVSDGVLTSSDTFVLTVNQPPDLSVEQSRGWDSATNTVYTNGFIGLNGGYGYSNWTSVRTGTLAGSYLETNGGRTFAIYAGGGAGNSFTASRSFPTAMTGGEVLRVQLGHTTVSAGGEIGMRMYSGTNTNALFALRLASGTTTQWQFNDGGTFFNSGLTSTNNTSGTPLSVMFKRYAGPGYDIQLTRGTNVVGGTNWGTNRPVMAIDRVEFYSTAQGANQNFRFANLERVMPCVSTGSPTFDLGTVRVAASGNTLTYNLRNDGTGPLSGLAWSKTGTNSAEFVIGSLATTNLAAGASTTFQVTFNPAGQALRTATLSLASNDPDENPFSLNVTGTGLNDAPAISKISDYPVVGPEGIGPIDFQVGDFETPANNLFVSARSSNQTLVPDQNILLGGSGSDRTITITPAWNQSGSTSITVTVSDGDRSVSGIFSVTVVSGSTFWRIQNFGSTNNSATTADTNSYAGDGIANLVKYALGMNPALAATNGLPEVGMKTNSSTNRVLTLMFNRQKIASDIVYEVQAEGDLFGFGTHSTIWSSTNHAYTSTGTAQKVTVEDTVEMDQTNRRFMRLIISRPP